MRRAFECDMRRASGLLCIFAKAPLAGRVKSRLWPIVGCEQGAALARAFLLDVILTARGSGCPWVVAADDVAGMRWVMSEHRGLRALPFWAQGPGELGERLERVLDRALGESAFAIAIGGDSPDLPADRLRTAARWLSDPEGPEVVLGPALDGGFYLFGSRVELAGLFTGARLGTPHALADMRRALERRGLGSADLEPWSDVDDSDDLAALAGRLSADPRRAPHSAACLRELGWLPAQRQASG